jgi:hypothetical protein
VNSATAERSPPSVANPRGAPDFSVIPGGPLFQIWRRTHLTGDALELVQRRVVVIALVCWLPLFVLAALQGQLLGGGLAVPFLLDVEAHIRFLVVVPLLILAEPFMHRRMRVAAQLFLRRGLVGDDAVARFEAAMASALRLRNSVTAEVLLIGVVYAVGILVVWRQYVALDVVTWYVRPTADGSALSPAGIWYGYVSLPMLQFLACRWYFRIFIWARFLWQVSRLRLNLVPTHPDRAGGLGFLNDTNSAFFPIAAAHGALLAGQIANRVLYVGTTLPDYKAEIATLTVIMLCLWFGPMLVFSRRLFNAKLDGLAEYGTLAQRYTREFDEKWLRGGAPAGEPLVGSGDVQSLADMAGSVEVVQSMRWVPFERNAAILLAVATLAPITPLLLTMMPLEELLKKMAGLVF